MKIFQTNKWTTNITINVYLRVKMKIHNIINKRIFGIYILYNADWIQSILIFEL